MNVGELFNTHYPGAGIRQLERELKKIIHHEPWVPKSVFLTKPQKHTENGFFITVMRKDKRNNFTVLFDISYEFDKGVIEISETVGNREGSIATVLNVEEMEDILKHLRKKVSSFRLEELFD